ncbi:MAG TPA: DUF6263 family protein [Gemmataceae bacterium]|jgi:hypothetical protein|nr:DUF6263 family protein [Gemmataceae bacterium]
MRLRLLAVCGLAFIVLTAIAQEKKDPVPPAKGDAPKTEAPKAEAPKKDAPKVDAPKVDAPKVDAPKTPDPKAPAPAGDNPLAWKFTKDVPFYQEMTTTTTQNIKVQGLDVGQNQQQTFYFSFLPIKQDGDKWIVKQTIEGVKMKIDIAGSPVSYDSTNEAAAGGTNTALSEFFKAIKGSQFTLTLLKDGTVEKVEGRDEFVKKLTQSNKQLEALLNKILSEEAIKQMADPTFGVTPKEVKKEKESWPRTVKLSLGPLGSYENTYTFTYAKQTGDIADIDVKVGLKYTPPGPDTAGETLPFKIKAGTITQVADEKTNKGTVKFNTKSGRIESSKIDIKMSGSLTLDIGGTTTEVTLTQDQSTEVKTSDKSFVPDKKQ